MVDMAFISIFAVFNLILAVALASDSLYTFQCFEEQETERDSGGDYFTVPSTINGNEYGPPFMENFLRTKMAESDFHTSAGYEYELLSEKYLRNSYTAFYKNTIGIQVSRRVTHQLSSRIFAIFLKEILGYKNIKLIYMHFENLEEKFKQFKNDEQFKLHKTLKSLVAPYGKWPMSAIDLEVWMNSDYQYAIPPQISQAGLMTNPGRFGWFVPKLLSKQFTYDMLHFSVFLNPDHKYYSNFMLNNPVLEQMEKKFGLRKIFTPTHCNGSQCVSLFAEYYTDTAFIIKHIEELKLYVKVVWLEENYKSVIKWLYNHSTEYIRNQKTFILLHWTPSDIIDTEFEYETITMPKCEEIETSQETLCKYELTPLLKYYALKFRSATHGFNALETFHLPKEEIRKLLKDYNQASNNMSSGLDSIYDNIACKWLKENEKIYTQWIVPEPAEITIGGIFPLSETGGAYRNILPAVRMAVNAINRNTSILPNFNLTVLENDGQCRSDIVMKTFIHYFNLNPLIGVLGPACSETVEPIAGISKHTRMAVISYSAEGATFTDRETYPYFFRTIGSNIQYKAVYLKLFQKLKWSRVAALTEDGQKYTEYISYMETLLKQNEMELITNKKFPKDTSASEMSKHLLDLKNKNARIIIADIYNDVAQVVMCEAYRLKMTAYDGYVWFLPVWLAKNWMNGSHIQAVQNVNCSSEELFKAINGHFSLAHAPFGRNFSQMQENISVGEWLANYNKLTTEISDYAGFAYDAVWVYALAAHQLLQEDPTAINDLRSPNIIQNFVDIIWKTDFNGLSGRVRFGKGGSRINDINILQWVDGTFKQIGIYTPVIKEGKELEIEGGNLDLNEKAIIWFSKSGQPKDGTIICTMAAIAGFLKIDCENVTFIITSLSCLFIVVLVFVFSFIFWKRQYDRKLKQSAKVMRNFGIDLLSPSNNMNNTLDKWEIPKDKVVINRRLGEGAFGTVYGGEAQFTDGGWTAVAVKTLKIGASTEDRLDFLSEAEAMKRFDHKNIVKLLGVCLQTEPIYTIMEFMLYGDLKTFLLARRHLVNEKVTDDSDISPKRLTMMALDIARGLTYLTEQKYVHRDIACRNCLVNAQRVVKVGDFGMARPMFENEYYRFNRKGMLPVRWMAPESLGLGVFTPSSDIWSFGILLYEIITFGSFPYQGLTNNEVLEHIKCGKTLRIPTGTKPHLNHLMRACFEQDYKLRPTALQIVEYISNYPRLLTPCLDVPIASVQMPETDSDQMELLPRLRKRTNTQSTLDILARGININNFDQRPLRKINGNPIQALSINIQNMNVPLDSVSNDDNNINSYSQIEPLLRQNPDMSNSNLSLKRYVPMCGVVCNGYNLKKASIEREHDIIPSGTTAL